MVKDPDLMVLIEEMEKDFDFSKPKESIEKLKARMQERGYSTEGIDDI